MATTGVLALPPGTKNVFRLRVAPNADAARDYRFLSRTRIIQAWQRWYNAAVASQNTQNSPRSSGGAAAADDTEDSKTNEFIVSKIQETITLIEQREFDSAAEAIRALKNAVLFLPQEAQLEQMTQIQDLEGAMRYAETQNRGSFGP